jgi:hypothetical protein
LEEFKQIQHFQLTYDSPYEDALNIAKLLPAFSNLLSFSINANFPPSAIVDEFQSICFCQYRPSLQRFNLQGSAFDLELPMMDNVCMFSSPSLLHIHVGKIRFNMAIQLLNLCPRLRSFTAKFYGPYSWEDSTVASSIVLPTCITMGLTALKELNLNDDDYSMTEYSSRLLELLLPCCSNLRTFSFAYNCTQRTRRPLDPHWWTRVLAFNNKMTRISLNLRVFGTLNYLSEEAVRAFRSLQFFTRLRVIVTYSAVKVEFPRMFHIYSIETEDTSR